MSRRKNKSLFEDIVEVGSRFPWWVGVVLAILSFAILNHLASVEIDAPAKPALMGNYAVKQLYKSLAFFGQIILPAAFLLGSVIAIIKNKKREKLFSDTAHAESVGALNSMSWQEFETLVGEAFRVQGYSISETGGGGADGGIDLVLKKGTETFFVQCKQWRAYKVGVKTVRELYGVMASRGAAGGYVVTSGQFTEDAKEFASGRNIELINGKALNAMIKSAQAAKNKQTR